MSTDRELLEMAAKAAGGEIALGRWNGEKLHIYTGEKSYTWNPLTDDGDALRLAVTLRLAICPFVIDGHIRIWRAELSEGWQDTQIIGDEMAATRFAIVYAAAEIGKAMP